MNTIQPFCLMVIPNDIGLVTLWNVLCINIIEQMCPLPPSISKHEFWPNNSLKANPNHIAMQSHNLIAAKLLYYTKMYLFSFLILTVLLYTNLSIFFFPTYIFTPKNDTKDLISKNEQLFWLIYFNFFFLFQALSSKHYKKKMYLIRFFVVVIFLHAIVIDNLFVFHIFTLIVNYYCGLSELYITKIKAEIKRSFWVNLCIILHCQQVKFCEWTLHFAKKQKKFTWYLIVINYWLF